MSIAFYICFILFFTSSVLSTKDEDDYSVLLRLKKQLGDPDFLQSWEKGFNFCNLMTFSTSKTYVSTDCTSTGRVGSLALFYFDNITVPFPDAICDLTELNELVIVAFPGLYGPIPSCITRLLNLRYLTIGGTNLSGSVPSFYNHTNITSIRLYDNHLSGKIPSSLSTLPNLLFLDLDWNNLTGPIPPGIFHGSPYAVSLSLSYNNLTGEVPKCYGLVEFWTFNVRNNQLSGDASFLFGKQKRTNDLILANNDFEFDLSYVEFPDSLYWLDLSHNRIYGKVPKSFVTATRLSYVDLSFNRLCGELPQSNDAWLAWRFGPKYFENNLCLCGNPLPPCSSLPPPPV